MTANGSTCTAKCLAYLGCFPPPLYVAMPVQIEQCTCINIGGKLSWKVKPSQSVNVDGETFVKIAPSDSNLVRVMCEGIVDPKLLKNGSLSQCRGFKDNWLHTHQAWCQARASKIQL